MLTLRPIHAALIAAAMLAGCGQPAEKTGPTPAEIARAAPLSPTPAGPVFQAVGTVAVVEGSKITMDHEAVAGGLAAGRTVFRAYADALAEAPLAPGARVAFSYQMAGGEPFIIEMKGR